MMTNVIQFPVNRDSQGFNFKAKLDKMNFPSEELRHCVEDNLIPVLEKYSKLTPYTMELKLPVNLNQTQVDELTSSLQEQMKQVTSNIQTEMLSEIAALYLDLCKCTLKTP